MSAAMIEEKRELVPSTPQVGVTLYSCVRSLRGFLLGLTLCWSFPRCMNNPGDVGFDWALFDATCVQAVWKLSR
jgi:hypothetical protein